MADGNIGCHGVFRRLLERQVVNIKNIASDDQVTLRAGQNSATIAQSF